MIELTERSICHKKVRRLKDYDYTFYQNVPEYPPALLGG